MVFFYSSSGIGTLYISESFRVQVPCEQFEKFGGDHDSEQDRTA